MINYFTNIAMRMRTYFEQSSMFNAIRHALTLMIPFMTIGSFAILFVSIPIKGYQDFMQSIFGLRWTYFFKLIQSAAFGILSILTIITVSNLYISEVSNKTKTSANPLIGSMISLSCYIALLGLPLNVDQLGTTGLFIALLVTVISSKLYVKTMAIKALNLSSFTDGVNPIFGISLHSIIPAAITLLPFALAGSIGASLGLDSSCIVVNEFLLGVFVKIGDTLLGGLLFSFLVHLLWFFGIHGHNILEYVTHNLYLPAASENQVLGASATHILTKPFFDTFVIMGGSGATMCLLIAIFIWGRNTSTKRHARMSLLPSIFNINELVLFGLPIVLEPIYLIPFLMVPMVLTATTFIAMSLGIVPYTQQMVEWTTPIFLSGYLVTGSISGSLLQLFNLCIGIMIYKPFLKISEDFAVKRDLNNYKRLVTIYMNEESSQSISLNHDELGNTARVLISELELAIKRNQLCMHYQPQFNTEDSVIGLESLLRWQHVRYGFIYPPLILALAEEGGFGDVLCKWIVNAVLVDTERLNQLGYTGLTNSINLSAKQLKIPHLVDHILDQIKRYNLSTKQISIEVTEHLALSGDPRIHEALTHFNQVGIKLSMDDFGMGHSSLMYLKAHRFDTIKLDGALVKDIVHDKISQEIIMSIYHLCQSLEISILAEFVETRQQRDKLLELGCTQYQGYLFSKALSFDALTSYLSYTKIQSKK